MSSYLNKHLQTKGSVIYYTDALDIFNYLADQDDIAFNFVEDGCYARAHIMCKKLRDLGITPQKAWSGLQPGNNDNIKVIFHDAHKIEWGYHVAPVLEVKKGYNTELIVFDPSLFDAPVTIREWAKAQKEYEHSIIITPLGADAPHKGKGGYQPALEDPPEGGFDTHANNKMKEYKEASPIVPYLRFRSKWARRHFNQLAIASKKTSSSENLLKRAHKISL